MKNEIVNKEMLFVNEHQAVSLCEYEYEIDLLKVLIEHIEDIIIQKETEEGFSYEGVCYKLLKL